MKKVLIYVGCAVVLIVGIGMVVLYTMGDRIFDEVIRSQLESIDKSIEDSIIANNAKSGGDSAEAMQQAAGPVEQGSASAGVTPGDGNTSGDNQKSVSNTASGNTGKTSGKTGSTASGKTAGAIKETGAKSSGSGADNNTISPEAEKNDKITIEKISEIKDKVSAVDKMEAAALVLKRLSPAEIKMLTKMLADGITPEEKAQAEKLAYSKFTAEEIKKIRDLYLKYMLQ